MNATTTKHEATLRVRRAHHLALAKFANVKGSEDDLANAGLKIWRKLRRIEQEAHRMAESYCNGTIDSDSMDKAEAFFSKEVGDILGQVPRGFFVNRDPRGYALKLDPEFMHVPDGMQKDWGGYGLLAPEID